MAAKSSVVVDDVVAAGRSRTLFIEDMGGGPSGAERLGPSARAASCTTVLSNGAADRPRGDGRIVPAPTQQPLRGSRPLDRWDDTVPVEFPALQVLDDESQRRILAGAHRRRYRRGEVIFHAGDPANTLHLLVTGHVSGRGTTSLGDTAIFAVLSPGAIFGELSLLGDGAARSATIEALEPTETLVLTTDDLRRLRAMSPEVDAFLLGLLAGYIRRQDARLLEALYVPADKRVLRRLLELATDYGAGRPGTVVPLTQDTVASMAGTTRPTANQVLRAAEEAGLITIGRGRIRVDDPVRLARRDGWGDAQRRLRTRTAGTDETPHSARHSLWDPSQRS